MSRNLLLTIILTGLFCQPVLPQSARIDVFSQRTDRFVKSEKERLGIPGLSLIVLKKSEIIKESHLGYANLELNIPVNEHSAFSIASISKTYTAAAALLLAERGKLNLDDGIRKYLPDAPDAWESITLRQLIGHTSGLVDDWALHDDWENTHTSIFATADNNEAFLKALYRTPLQFKPGTSIKYGCGAFLIGLVIEKVSGKSYAQFMREEMFAPLGLTETWVDDPLEIIPHRVSGYVLEKEKLRNGFKVSAATLARADVSIRTSARDIAKWLTALRAGKLLGEKSLKLMTERVRTSDGLVVPSSLGWFVWPFRAATTIDHTGGYRTGFSAVVVEYVEDDLTIILLTNRAGSGSFDFAQRIAAIYNPDYRFIKDLPVEKAPPNAPTEKFERTVKAIAAGKIDASAMHENFPIAFYRNSLQKTFAAVKSIEFLSRRDVSAKNRKIFGAPVKEIWFYRLDGERPRYAGFSVGADGRVVFVDYPES